MARRKRGRKKKYKQYYPRKRRYPYEEDSIAKIARYGSATRLALRPGEYIKNQAIRRAGKIKFTFRRTEKGRGSKFSWHKKVLLLPPCNEERKRVRRAYFGFLASVPSSQRKSGSGAHNNKFTRRPCR